MAVADDRGGATTPPATSKPKIPVDTLDLGTKVIVYFSDGTTQVFDKSRFPSEGTTLSPNTIAQIAAQEREGAAGRELSREQIAEQQRQFNERFGMDKARFNLEFPLEEGRVTGYYKSAPTLSREQFGEGQRQFDTNTALAYYRHLGELASNPRNFMQQFFTLRGQQGPAGAERFGNAPPLSAIRPFEQFLPDFLRGAGAFSPSGSVYGYGAARPQYPAQAAPAAVQSAPVVQQAPSVQPVAVPTLRNIQPQQDVNIPQGARTTLAPIGPVDAKTNTQPAQTISLSDFVVRAAKEAGVTPEDYFRKNLAAYARGGVIPEPVVGRGLISGRPYTFGEEGPEGVVPSEFLPDFLRRRRGRAAGPVRSYAIGGEIGFEGSYEENPYFPPHPPDPYGFDTVVDDRQYATPYQVDLGPGTPITYTPDFGAPSTTAGPAPAPVPATTPVTAQPPAPALGITPEQQRAILAEIERVRLLNQQQQTVQPPVVVPPVPPVQPPATVTPIVEQVPQPQTTAPITSAPAAPVVQLPTFVPQQGVTAGAASAAGAMPTPRDVSAPGTFGNLVGTSSTTNARPQFLPGEDTPLASLLENGYLPPFLSRVLAQAQGIPSQGTNQPQRLDLPRDVPIVSRLAWLQMTPSERQGLLSYVSAYGIAPEDYLAFIEQFSPTGPQTQLPTFGQPFFSYRQ